MVTVKRRSSCEISVPRDRNGEFEPKVIEKRQTRTDEIYPVIFFDGIMFNSRKDNKSVNKCVYSVLGINMVGRKEILGTWISENKKSALHSPLDTQQLQIRSLGLAYAQLSIYFEDRFAA